MKKPKKPNYSKEQIELMNEKLLEADKLKTNIKKKEDYIYNHISKKARLAVKIDKIDNIISQIFVWGTIVCISFIVFFGDENNYNSGLTIKTIGALFFSFFMGYLIGSAALAFIASILGSIIPDGGIHKKIFKDIYQKYEKEYEIYREKYINTINNKFSEYIMMNEELEKYSEDLEEYNYYCIRKEKDFWYRLDGHEFEKEIAKVFKKLGYTTKVSRIGADGGVDIVLTKDDKKYAVQCKAHSDKISESVARDLYGVLHAKNFDGGFLVTLNGVSSNTRRFCSSRKDKPIEIWTINEILKNHNK